MKAFSLSYPVPARIFSELRNRQRIATTVRALQSKWDLETPSTRQTSIFRTKRFFLRERLVSRCQRIHRLCSLRPAIGERSVPMNLNRDVLPFNGVESLNRMSTKKNEELVSKGLAQARLLAERLRDEPSAECWAEERS
jgi:hypothetical protein